jgi:prevent-host-death family protein
MDGRDYNGHDDYAEGAPVNRRVGTAEAKAKLSELIGTVAYGHDRVLIQRRGRPIAALVGLDDLRSLERSDVSRERPRGALALVGLWADLGDDVIDQMVDDIYAARESDMGRPVELDE